MARYVTFGDNLLDLDAVRLATFHRAEGWLEVNTAGQVLVVEGRERSEAIWKQLQEALKPMPWPWPDEEPGLGYGAASKALEIAPRVMSYGSGHGRCHTTSEPASGPG